MTETGAAKGNGYSALFAHSYRASSFTSVMAVFIGSLDSLIISTALPTISQHLHGAQLYAVAVGAYMVANLVALPVFGAMTDQAGPWRTFLLAGSVFVGGSILGGFAPAMLFVVLARAIQGLGAGGLFAVGYAAIGRQLPPRLQPHGLALLSATWGTSSLLGPAVGALFISTIGWRWVFWFNVPLVLALLPAARAAFSGVGHAAASAAPNNILGPLILGAMAAAMLAAFSAPFRWAFLLGALACFAILLFVLQERTAERPVLPALRRPGSIGAGSIVAAGLTGVSYVAVQTYLPLFLQAGRGASPYVYGGILAAGSVFWTVGSVTAARLIHHGTRWPLAVGHVSFCAGAVLLMFGASAHLSVAVLYAGFIVAGMGVGFTTPSLFTMTLADAPRGSEGVATSSVQALRALGNGLGAGLAGLVFRLSVPGELFALLGSNQPAEAIRAANLAGFLDAALVHCWAAAALIVAVSALLVLRLPAVRPQQAADVQVAAEGLSG